MSQQADRIPPTSLDEEARKRLVRAMVKQVIEEIVDEDYHNPLVPGLAEALPDQVTVGEG